MTKKAKHKSGRADGRGGWLPGKRRNQDVGDWSRIRIGLAAVLNAHYRPGQISGRALAAAVGVSERTVRRWLSGEDRPPAEDQERCRQWLTEQRERLKKRTKANR